MELKGYEVLEVVGDAFLNASQKMKSDNNLSKGEIISLIIETLKDLADEAMDKEENE